MENLGNLIAETLKQHNASPWHWLYEVVLERTTVATSTARLTSFSEELTFEGKTWYPFPIIHRPIKTDSAGNLPQIEIVATNVRQSFTRLLETSKGSVGLPVTIALVHKAHLGTGDKVESTFEIRSSTAVADAISIRCQPPDLYQLPIPQAVHLRDRCRWRYLSDECGYRGARRVCDKTLQGPDGCIVSGQDEAAAGRPVLHPGNFSAAPAMPRAVRA